MSMLLIQLLSSVVIPPGGGGDPNAPINPLWTNVVFLSGWDGLDGAKPGIDESSFKRAISYGGTSAVSTTKSKFDASSLRTTYQFNNASTPFSTDFCFGANEAFAVEGWFNFDATVSNVTLLGMWDGGNPGTRTWRFGLEAGKLILHYFDVGSGERRTEGLWTPVANTWYHLAASRTADGTVRVYANGVMIAKTTGAAAAIRQGFEPLLIGRSQRLDGYEFNGYMDEVRITKGEALYTSDSGFNVPNAKFERKDLSLNSVVFLMGWNGATGDKPATSEIGAKALTYVGTSAVSTAQYQFGGASLRNNTGDYVQVGGAVSALVPGNTEDWTCEGWVRFDATNVTQAIIGAWGTTTTDSSFYLVYSGGQLHYEYRRQQSSGATKYDGRAFAPVAGTWYHFAIVKDAAKHRVYINGTSIIELVGTNEGIFAGSNPLVIGNAQGWANATSAKYVDEVRITKGVARYTANFTPPVAQFPRT